MPRKKDSFYGREYGTIVDEEKQLRIIQKPVHTMDHNPIIEEIEKIRNKLLDMSARNRLLNFKSGAQSLQIVDEYPLQVFQTLVNNEQTMAFKPIPDNDKSDGNYTLFGKQTIEQAAKQAGIDIREELPQEPIWDHERLRKHDDLFLQTKLFMKDLETKLRRMASTARTCIEETGQNRLYMAMGYLRWKEAENMETAYEAPLILIPVEIVRDKLERKSQRFMFQLRYNGEDLSHNVCLAEKLRRDFGIVLPDFDDDEIETDAEDNHAIDPEKYFNKVQTAVEGMREWKVLRKVNIGFYSFSKLLMYKDLDPKVHGETIKQHPIIQRILLPGKDPKSSLYNDTESDDSKLGELEQQIDGLPLVLDADSSQSNALLKALLSQSFVIQGPPGTGKSQTITNLIAGFLHCGKTVLFVAEKMAALEVVQRNLTKAGLGDFCLELHSHKSNKAEILASLKERHCKRYNKPRDLDYQKQRLVECRKSLSEYLNILQSEYGPNTEPIYDILWKAERYRNEYGQIHYDIPNAGTIVASEIDQNCQLFDQLKEYSDSIFEVTPWIGFSAHHVLYGDETAVRDILEKAKVCQNNLLDLLRKLTLEFQFPFQPENTPISVYRDNLSKLSSIHIPETICISLFHNMFQEDHTDSHKVVQNLVNKIGEIKTCRYNNINLTCPDLSTTITQFLNQTAVIEDPRINNITLSDLRSLLDHYQIISGKMDRVYCFLTLIYQHRFPPVKSIEQLDEFMEGIAFVQKESKNTPEKMALLFSPEEISQCSRLVSEYKQIRQSEMNLSTVFELPDVPCEMDIPSIRKILRQYGNSFWGRFRTDFRTAKLTLRCFTKNSTLLQNLRPDSPLYDWLDQLDAFRSRLKAFGEDQYRQYPEIHERLSSCLKWHQFFKPYETHVGVALNQLMPAFCSNCPSVDSLREILPTFKQELIHLQEMFSALGIHQLCERSDLFKLISSLQRLFHALGDIEKRMTPLCLNNASIQDITHETTAYQRYQAIQREIEDDRYLPGILGSDYQGLDTDIDKVNQTINLCTQIDSLCYRVLFQHCQSLNDIQRRFNTLKEYATHIELLCDGFTLADEIKQYGDIDDQEFWGGVFSTLSIPALLEKINRLLDQTNTLLKWADYQRILKDIRDRGLYPIFELVRKREIPVGAASDAYRCVHYNSLVRRIFDQYPALRRFTGASYEQVRKAFKETDLALQQLFRETVAYHASRSPIPPGETGKRVADFTEGQLLKREFAKLKRHIPIRSLLSRATLSIKAIKPVFMMSPLSVAQFLPQGQHQFDIVIMDEASQILLQDALGAILRGKQLVVVGDKHQLPPTPFFIEDTEDEEQEDQKSIVDDIKSILELCESSFSSTTLRWHYRSKHESLIAFSNSEWYNNELIIYPSNIHIGPEMGVKYHYVPNAKYAKSRNEMEAEIVAKRIIQHYRNHLNQGLSLGVGTLNIKQKRLIEDYLDMMRKKDPSIEQLLSKAFSRDNEEPLFIKNLENLQGDERDVIMISCTYGPDSETGRVFQRFGPINSEDGCKRLNVLITRARQRLEVYSSMSPEDILGGPDAKGGVLALKSFLAYARDGKMPEYGTITHRAPGSDFEISVAKFLSQQGYDVVAQVGVAGYFIDLAVRNPYNKDAYILGIECDGAPYHSSVCARDRDRLRGEILTRRGWTIHRIWSVEWYRNPGPAKEKLLLKLAQIVESVRPAVVPVLEPESITEEIKDTPSVDIHADQLSDVELLEQIVQYAKENNLTGGIWADGAIFELMVRNRISSMPEFREYVPANIRGEFNPDDSERLNGLFQIVDSAT